MSTLAFADRAPSAAPAPAPPVLRRACACGGTPGPTGECEQCRKQRLGVQRSAAAAGPALAPPIVHGVLRSPGALLDAGTRAEMEPRFRHSFADVRVHADGEAAASARAVGAHAYTVGRSVVFAAGRYAPGSMQGKRLIAHELAHVVQQRGSASSSLQPRLEVGAVDDPAEREADAAASAVMRGASVPAPAAGGAPALRRQDAIPIDLVPTSPEESKKLKEMGVNLPTVSDETWRSIGGVADNAGKTLSEGEKTKIAGMLKTTAPAGSALAFSEGPRFVLHDTASPVGAKSIAKEGRENRGPLGKGVYGWVPAAGDPTVTRNGPFESKRPTTTEWEKGADLISQGDREKAFRQVWKAADAAQHQPALDRALAGTGLTADELKAEQTGASTQLGGTGKIFTTAAWAVGEICAAAAGAGGAAGVAAAGKEADLTSGCATLKPYFDARTARVQSTTNVEIVQGENQLSCAHPEKTTPAPSITYTDDQYRGVTILYLRAALAAGRFPEVTTHFWVDRSMRGHCDPRCFNVKKLYDTIATNLGHGIGSTYGITPSYGITWGTHNVWWYDPVCGAKP